MTTAISTPTQAPIAHRDAPLVAALLACYLVWGSTYLAIRIALVSFPPFFQMATRFLVAGALLLAWTFFVQKRPLPNARQWLHALVVGGLMVGCGMGAVAQASTVIGSGLIAVFVAVLPLMVCGWGLLAGRRLRGREWAGIAVGMAGAVLLVRGASFAAAPHGVLLLLLATGGWSLGSVLSTTRTPLAPGATGFASEMLCGGALLGVASLVVGERFVWPPAPLAVAAWLYLVVFGSLVAFSAYLYLLAQASHALATSYAFVNPVIALALGAWLGGEAISHGEWVASAVVLMGVVLIAWPTRRRVGAVDPAATA